MRQDLVFQLEKALSQALRQKLLGYAYSLVRGRVWPGEYDLRELAQDVVSEAICKTITGERRWEPDSCGPVADLSSPETLESLKSHLFSSVQSIVDARNKHNENKLQRKPLDAPEALAKEAPIQSVQANLEADEFFCGLILELGDDDVCCRILDLYEKGYKANEIAAKLGEDSDGEPKLTTPEIYAANKRLKRKARAYLQKLRAES
ncbi:MAG: hypothetical protein ACO1SV_10500 [Fimbriimonas sp.]